MTLVRFKNKPVSASFNNFMDDLFSTMPSLFRDDFNVSGQRQFVPVNIKENEQGYLLEVIAPGLEKEDFKINLEQNVLTISAEKKAETENANEKEIRKEYKYQSFKRSFTVDENIDAENISAKYVNGVLTLNLPKQAEVKEAPKQITIQ
jgi:HSP20 family protein